MFILNILLKLHFYRQLSDYTRPSIMCLIEPNSQESRNAAIKSQKAANELNITANFVNCKSFRNKNLCMQLNYSESPIIYVLLENQTIQYNESIEQFSLKQFIKIRQQEFISFIPEYMLQQTQIVENIASYFIIHTKNPEIYRNALQQLRNKILISYIVVEDDNDWIQISRNNLTSKLQINQSNLINNQLYSKQIIKYITQAQTNFITHVKNTSNQLILTPTQFLIFIPEIHDIQLDFAQIESKMHSLQQHIYLNTNFIVIRFDDSYEGIIDNINEQFINIQQQNEKVQGLSFYYLSGTDKSLYIDYLEMSQYQNNDNFYEKLIQIVQKTNSLNLTNININIQPKAKIIQNETITMHENNVDYKQLFKIHHKLIAVLVANIFIILSSYHYILQKQHSKQMFVDYQQKNQKTNEITQKVEQLDASGRNFAVISLNSE